MRILIKRKTKKKKEEKPEIEGKTDLKKKRILKPEETECESKSWNVQRKKKAQALIAVRWWYYSPYSHLYGHSYDKA